MTVERVGGMGFSEKTKTRSTATRMLSKLRSWIKPRPRALVEVSKDNSSKKTVDNVVDRLIDHYADSLGSGVPDAYRIWSAAQKHIRAGDEVRASQCHYLNYILHNSYIPNSARLGEGVKFGYGGIGIVLHADSEIQRGAVIGSNVTLGGRTGSKLRAHTDGRQVGVPLIREHSYLSTGSKILGGVTVGPLSIVGANAVVTDDVPPLTIVAGAPARIVGRITVENCARYKGTFTPLRNLPNSEFAQMVGAISESTQR